MTAMPTLSLDERARLQLKRWRYATGRDEMTQAAMAAAIGKDQSWLSRYWTGTYDADLETLDALARVFGHSIAEVFLPPGKPTAVVSDDETRLLENFRACGTRARQTLLAVSDVMSRSERRPGRNRPPHEQAG